MTVALELARRGCQVKLYEQKSMLGGNLGSRERPGGELTDIYPHMYLAWYRNFWRMIDSVGVDRAERFAEFSTVYQLRRNGEHFAPLRGGYTPRRMLENLSSGVATPPEMFLLGYAMVDLLAERTEPTVLLANMTLSGFLSARRPYMTRGVIEAVETFITSVWAIPAYLVSAEDCWSYLAYSFADPEPQSWLARGPAQEVVVAPVQKALLDAGVEIRHNAEVVGVRRQGARASTIALRRTRFSPRSGTWQGTGPERTEEVDELVLALPPKTLAALVRRGAPGERLVDAEGDLAQFARLSTQQVPIVYLHFKRRLEQIPLEPVGLFDSKLLLAFTDVSRTWPGLSAGTVLAVSCSEPYGLAGADPTENGFQIVEELGEYLHFRVGAAWGESPDIDWERTHFDENTDAQLSLNAIGTDPWRPAASYERLDNVAFAGDLCRQDIGLTTIESAVASGLEASNAIIARRGIGEEIEVLRPRTLPGPYYVFLRYALLPTALAMKALSCGLDPILDRTPRGKSAESLLRYLLTPGLAPRGHRRDS
jgi:hypothetical protein